MRSCPAQRPLSAPFEGHGRVRRGGRERGQDLKLPGLPTTLTNVFVLTLARVSLWVNEFVKLPGMSLRHIYLLCLSVRLEVHYFYEHLFSLRGDFIIMRASFYSTQPGLI